MDVPGGKWTVKAKALELGLAERFTIARESWESTRNVFVEVTWNGTSGLGESCPSGRWDETAESVVEMLNSVDVSELLGPFDLEGILDVLPPGSARCALDIALHDLAARLAGITVAELLGVAERPRPPTSVTVPIADLEQMVERARRFADHPVLKMKVGFDGDVGAVAAVRSAYRGRVRIDANEGWSADEAGERLDALATHDIELCEQPIPAGDVDALARVTKESPIPVFADEEVCTSADVARLVGAVDGVNLKLRKTGGIREFLRAAATARAHGLSVMIGCDLESGIAATAQASVAALADHADIDGPLLLRTDPYPGVTYERGVFTLPVGPGLGVTPSILSVDDDTSAGLTRKERGEPT
jgi:L-alanine-DL-glutamate epimerase-like enolase superfamily enzyme